MNLLARYRFWRLKRNIKREPRRSVTKNYGLTGGTLDVSRHVEMFTPGPDGYIDMTAYNDRAPWSGETAAANAAAAELLPKNHVVSSN